MQFVPTIGMIMTWRNMPEKECEYWEITKEEELAELRENGMFERANELVAARQAEKAEEHTVAEVLTVLVSVLAAQLHECTVSRSA